MFNIYFSNLHQICLIKLHTIKLILTVLKFFQECNENIFTRRLTLFVRIIKQNNLIHVIIIFNSKREKPSAINRHFYYLLQIMTLYNHFALVIPLFLEPKFYIPKETSIHLNVLSLRTITRTNHFSTGKATLHIRIQDTQRSNKNSDKYVNMATKTYPFRIRWK